jgi:hypothetical protein
MENIETNGIPAPASDAGAASNGNAQAAISETKHHWREKSTKRPTYPRKASEELLRDFLALEREPAFAGKTLSGPLTDPAFLLRKVEIYSAWMTRHAARPPSTDGRSAPCIRAQPHVDRGSARWSDQAGRASPACLRIRYAPPRT